MHRTFESARRGDTGETITFDLNGHKYEASPDAPGGELLSIAAIANDESKTDADRGYAILSFLDTVLLGDSAERFAERFGSAEDPITLAQAGEVMIWLIAEVYTGRPTPASSPSASGPSTTGPSSTAPLPTEASIPSDSVPVDSST